MILAHRFRQYSMPAIYVGGSAPFSYTGPGDILSGAKGWWGLFAYSSASVGSNCITLRRDSDQASTTFTTTSTSSGCVNISAITTFKGTANLFVTKLFDQSGNGFDAVQTTTANQPPFFLNQLGTATNLPTIKPDGATFYFLSGTMTGAATQALTFVSAFETPNPGSPGRFVWCSGNGTNSNNINMGYSLNGNDRKPGFSLGGAIDSAVNTTGFHSYVASNLDGSNTSASNVDSNFTSGISAGSDFIASGEGFNLFAFTTGIRLYDGKFGEAGVWSNTYLSSSQMATLNSNIHSRWAF